MTSKEERKENALLATELGYEQGMPRYQWRWSEHLLFPFRVEGESVENRSPGGLVILEPKYELRKAANHLFRQWVICKWLDPGPEDQWRAAYGAHMEYPRNGIYFPTNVVLDPDINPCDTNEAGVSITQVIVGMIREQAKKSLADWKKEGEDIIAYKEKLNDHRIDEIVGDVLLPFGHEPGTRSGGVSLPSAASSVNHDKAFSTPPERSN
jgi:hypothetical protein